MSEPALIGFPSNPTVDEEHDGWIWDGTKWVQIETPAFEIDDDHLLKKAEDNIVPAEFAIHVAGGAMFKDSRRPYPLPSRAEYVQPPPRVLVEDAYVPWDVCTAASPDRTLGVPLRRRRHFFGVAMY